MQFLYLGHREKSNLQEYENEALANASRLLGEFFYGYITSIASLYL